MLDNATVRLCIALYIKVHDTGWRLNSRQVLLGHTIVSLIPNLIVNVFDRFLPELDP